MRCSYRSVAQFGRALRSGRRGRGFESRRFDEKGNAQECLTGRSWAFLVRGENYCRKRSDGAWQFTTREMRRKKGLLC